MNRPMLNKPSGGTGIRVEQSINVGFNPRFTLTETLLINYPKIINV